MHIHTYMVHDNSLASMVDCLSTVTFVCRANCHLCTPQCAVYHIVVWLSPTCPSNDIYCVIIQDVGPFSLHVQNNLFLNLSRMFSQLRKFVPVASCHYVILNVASDPSK